MDRHNHNKSKIVLAEKKMTCTWLFEQLGLTVQKVKRVQNQTQLNYAELRNNPMLFRINTISQWITNKGKSFREIRLYILFHIIMTWTNRWFQQKYMCYWAIISSQLKCIYPIFERNGYKISYYDQ